MFSRASFSILGFSPRENTSGVLQKRYADGYVVAVDLERKAIDYGEKIKAESKTTQNFSQPENFVVLECVNRLLEKGYKPENIVLEKTYPSGHGSSGRLDILVTSEDKTAYLMIECKTYGDEFNKELKNIQKEGGQLFTYFQQDTKTELLMLYASRLNDNEILSDFKMIKIEEEFRTAGNVKETYKLWNKQCYEKGFWENPPYNFQCKKFTKVNLKELTEEAGQKLFHGFATILRKHSVSDKPNAFNVIFNLFLAKLYDEQKRDEDELEFHWRENDHPVDFQVRLYDLHKKGLLDFLKKEIEGIEKNFDAKITIEERRNAQKKFLKINKLFDIKEVLDDNDFEQNHRVLKEVVKLIEKYQIRYPRKQKYLSEFFELLLTTGLKQEVGQYFTPPPIAKFIVRSLPLQKLIEQEVNNEVPKLPAVIDFAAGSGHFITEILEEYQDIIENLNTDKFYPKAQKAVDSWNADPYNWAAAYIYGIEKDYRLVKVAKVGCYFYGDGLAQVVHGDGLDSFEKSKSYIGLLKDNAKKPQFSVLVSNPPYSVSDCKDDLEYIGTQHDFELYKSLTDKSKEIECLFVERTVQLLKEGGVAGIILPSSIFSNTGIYAKAREIILQHFEMIAVVELGSNTFMATGTNTVVLFLRKRKEAEVNRIREAAYRIAENYPKTHEDLTINGIESPVKKYLDYIGETELNPEKFYYFVLNYHQKTVIVKTGDKDAEKRFLGYEFSNRRGSEGMHSTQRGKTIEECTKLFNENDIEDKTKAAAYIYKAFNGDYDFPIDESLKNNIFRIRLVDMITFDRADFTKNISTSVKKKVRIESKWDIVKIGQVATTQYGFTDKASDSGGIRYLRITDLNDDGTINLTNEPKFINSDDETKQQFLLKNKDIVIARSGSVGKSAIYNSEKYEDMIFASYLIRLQVDENKILPEYLFYFTKTQMYWEQVKINSIAVTQPNLNAEKIKEFQIPLPPKEIQQKIVAEIEVLEKKERDAKEKVGELKNEIKNIIDNASGEYKKLRELCSYSDKRIDCSLLTSKNYIGVDNLLQNMMGKDNSNFVPDSGTATEYNAGNVLLSNIRPYLKKIWYADKNGGSSNDVLVIQKTTENVDSKYLFYNLKQDKFFDYEMQATKGIKMPRGDKQHILDYKIPLPPLSEQQRIVSEIEKIETQITELESQLAKMANQKEAVLKKYL